MADKIFLVKLKPHGFLTHSVVAAGVEIRGEHIALINAKGELAALFLLELIESWTALPRCQH